MRFQKKNLPSLQLRQRYEGGESTASLADAYKCTRQTIVTHLRRAGVTIRGRANNRRVTPDQISKMRELREQGIKYEAIALELGFSHATVYRHLEPFTNPHRPVLVEMLEILRDKLRAQLETLNHVGMIEPLKIREQRRQTIKKLEARIAALESVI